MAEPSPEPLTRFVAGELAAVADPSAAGPMAAYMKTEMPFYGVKKPPRTRILGQAAHRFPVEDRAGYEASVAALWEQPHREEKYLAIAWARHWSAYVGPDSMPIYERLIVEGAWWDFVDDVASHLVGEVLLRHRNRVAPLMWRWIDDPDMWLRRSALISQLRHGADTDEEMLFAFSLRRAHETEFFIRKAIGWALRQYARTNSHAVRNFVEAHRPDWSPLTYREATKNLSTRY